MLEIGPRHTIEYRQEVLTPIFGHVRSGESFFLVGGASMGKTRLLDFLMREDVQKHYLRDTSGQFWLIRVDMNRLAIRDEAWALYELILSSIILELGKHDTINELRAELVELDSKVIQSHDLLLSLRFLEMAVNRLCQQFEFRLCFLLDEFDEAYRNLSVETFWQLRALRDANKNRISYGIFLRNLPERLRPSSDHESFHELFSRNLVGLGPYSQPDALRFIQQLEARREHALNPDQRMKLFGASGGHPGVIQALLSVLITVPNSSQVLYTPAWIEWFGRQPVVIEECRKIRDGLDEDEKEALSALAVGDPEKLAAPVGSLLFAKRILRHEDGEITFFSPLFEHYVRSLR